MVRAGYLRGVTARQWTELIKIEILFLLDIRNAQ